MEREPENVIDGTARAHQWRRSPSTTVDDGPDGAEARSDAPKSIAGSLLVPVELLTEAAPLEQAPRHAGRAADPGRCCRRFREWALGRRGAREPVPVAGSRGSGQLISGAPASPRCSPTPGRCGRDQVSPAMAARPGLADLHDRAYPPPSLGIPVEFTARPAGLLARPGSAGRGRRWRRAGMTGLLVTVLVAAGCVVLAGVATQGGHPRVARPSLSRDRQLAAVGAGNDPFGDRRAVIAARAAAAKTAKANVARQARAKPKARTRRLARARHAARRTRQHRRRAVAPGCGGAGDDRRPGHRNRTDGSVTNVLRCPSVDCRRERHRRLNRGGRIIVPASGTDRDRIHGGKQLQSEMLIGGADSMPHRIVGHLRTNIVAYLALAVAIGGGGGYAIAATTTKTITVCANKQTGILYLHQHGRCSRRQKKISWNQRGATGAQGRPGPAGASAISVWGVVAGNGTVTSGQGLSVQHVAAGTYQVTVTAAGCAQGPNAPTVTVSDANPPDRPVRRRVPAGLGRRHGHQPNLHGQHRSGGGRHRSRRPTTPSTCRTPAPDRARGGREEHDAPAHAARV